MLVSDMIIVYGLPAEMEALDLFMAAAHAVVPDFPLRPLRLTAIERNPDLRSGRHLLEWMSTDPVGSMLVARVPDDQRSLIEQVLDGMLRERSLGDG